MQAYLQGSKVSGWLNLSRSLGYYLEVMEHLNMDIIWILFMYKVHCFNKLNVLLFYFSSFNVRGEMDVDSDEEEEEEI